MVAVRKDQIDRSFEGADSLRHASTVSSGRDFGFGVGPDDLSRQSSLDSRVGSSRRERPRRISLEELFRQQKISQSHKPHKANDAGWEAIQKVRERDGEVGLNHFKLMKRLGCGDIGSVYLAELRGTKFRFAMKVMDLGSLASRRKQMRAETERDILATLDHPFLPTLYAHFETPQFLCLVMEYCSGGDLHTLRQKQVGRCFTDKSAKFYAAEVLMALEYLHMMGVVYRDLKPENVLVRGDGHVMLSDFDLSLKCSVSPTLITYMNPPEPVITPPKVISSRPEILDKDKDMSCYRPTSCMPLRTRSRSIDPSEPRPAKTPGSKWKPRLSKSASKSVKSEFFSAIQAPLPELIAEPTGVRSMSFVGTHEYLAPEIIAGDGHGSAVDWWTFGIFLYELLYGKTPFKGEDNEITLVNVVSQQLEFPQKGEPYFKEVDAAAKELIKALLVKDPQKRLASKRGATEIKQHPFFEGINWALIRCTLPPQIPRPSSQKVDDVPTTKSIAAAAAVAAHAALAASDYKHKNSENSASDFKASRLDAAGDYKEHHSARFDYF